MVMLEKTTNHEVIYILTNEAMPEYVKIGRTNEEGLKDRIRQLSNTSVPLPFELFYACKVPKERNAETLLHGAFDKYRVSTRREFFEISPEEARFACNLTGGEEVILDEEEVVDDPSEKKALERAKERRSRFNFRMVDIQPGAVLQFTRDSEVEVIVVDNRQVRTADGETLSVSKAAKKLLESMGFRWSSYDGPRYFTYEGETLKARRERLDGGE